MNEISLADPMKTIRIIFIFLLIALALTACKQRDFTPEFSSTIVEVKSYEATIKGIFKNASNAEKQGVIYSTKTIIEYEEVPLHEEIVIHDSLVSLAKAYTLEDLDQQTKYYYRLFAIVDDTAFLSEESTFFTPCHGLGCSPAGGTIVWEDGLGGGIEVANNFITAHGKRGCEGTDVITDTIIGPGAANTSAILNDCGANSLAYKCATYSQNGFNDYYMPSINELRMIFSTLMVESENPFDYPTQSILSSSQLDANTCYAMFFNSGQYAYHSKSTDYYSTIPIRSF